MPIVILLLALSLAGCTKPKEIMVSRQGVIHSTALVKGIWNRVREIEVAACEQGKVTPEQCRELGKVDQQVRGMFREIDQQLQEVEYEMDWNVVIKTLDAIGKVLDALPLP